MFKHLLALVVALSTLTAVAAESLDARPAASTLLVADESRPVAMTRLTDGEIMRTASPRPAKAAPETPDTEESTRDVSWEMVLAAVAFMTAIALRRFRAGPR